MKNEFEIIEHTYIPGIRIFVVSMLYRTPHMHRDFELLLFLQGSIRLSLSGSVFQAKEGDMFLLNPFQIHELSGSRPALILSLQISPDFFGNYFPQIRRIRFRPSLISCHVSETGNALRSALLELGEYYLRKDDLYELLCASIVNRILFLCLGFFPWDRSETDDRGRQQAKEKRIRELTDLISRRSREKLLLSDIAEEMGVSVYYLSHFFKENFGISFQQYLSRIRCENARRDLLLTGESLLTISISNGFSDPKYFNRAFEEQYGVSPKQYRQQFSGENINLQQSSMLTTQEFLSDEASLVLLGRAKAELLGGDTD